MPDNHLYFGDNLDVLREHIESESVDLVYLDPPFNSNANYNVLFSEQSGEKAASQIQAFEDTWTWDEQAARTYFEVVQAGGEVANALEAFFTLLRKTNMMAYLAMMAPRLVELRRVLKPTGSIYLHCDPTASHYLKLLMDAVFGPDRFLDEIVWRRHNARSVEQSIWPHLHDVLLFYAKGAGTHFRATKVISGKAKMSHELVTGPDGQKYKSFDLTGAGLRPGGVTGQPWRGYDPAAKGRHWRVPHDTLELLDAEGRLHWPRGGGLPRERAADPFVPESRMVVVGDVWTDIDAINSQAAERLGYPTQKPEALLERIVTASSNEGDVVLDPFCGCGTAIAVAHRLKRRWVGIDITHLAVNLMKNRLLTRFGEEVKAEYDVTGEPTDIEGARQLAKDDPWQFQLWALGLVGARPVQLKKGADSGIDGRLRFHEGDPTDVKQIILSVKAGQNIGVGMVRDLGHVVKREGAAIGVLITMSEPTRPMKKEAASAEFYQTPVSDKKASGFGAYPSLQILTVEQLLAEERIKYPHVEGMDATFRRAPKAKPDAPDAASLFDSDDE